MWYARYSIQIIICCAVAVMLTVWGLAPEKAGTDGSIPLSGMLSTLTVGAMLLIPGKPRLNQTLLCWFITLCLYWQAMLLEGILCPGNDYMSSLVGMLMPLVLPPLLLMEAVGIWLLSSLRRQDINATKKHNQFLDAIREGELQRVQNLLPDVYINDSNTRGETALQLAVQVATDPVHPQKGCPMQIITLLIQQGAEVRGCLDAMVKQHEFCFEGTDRESDIYRAAAARAVNLIPLLAAAGDTISRQALDSARYNCDPSIQQALTQVPTELPELPEE